jgi:Tfp pilus assembly protein FimT
MRLAWQRNSAGRLPPVGQSRLSGLSTAELVGIIVIIGVLGSLSTAYITNLISTSKANTGTQNAQSLNNTLTSAISAGAVVDTSTTDAAISDLNTGVTVGTGANALTFRMNPPILNSSSYSLDSATNLFSYTSGNP